MKPHIVISHIVIWMSKWRSSPGTSAGRTRGDVMKLFGTSEIHKVMTIRGYKTVKYPSGQGSEIWYLKSKVPYSSQINVEELRQIIQDVIDTIDKNDSRSQEWRSRARTNYSESVREIVH